MRCVKLWSVRRKTQESSVSARHKSQKGEDMLVKKAELKAVAVKKNQYPEDTLPEVAFAGRSNVGKSSLLNTLTNRKNLARVSGTPGKTRTINFFQINDAFRIVDLPGYGYAKLSKSATADWGNMMETYLANRENLRLVIQLVDIRHEPTAQDVQMYQWLQHYGLDGVVVATKADKISRNQLRTQMNLIRKTLGMSQDDIVLPVSSLKKTGYEDLWSVIEQIVSDEPEEELE
ncbi:MAG: YihA family ribosome biogenesis GTP-binding protein [Firmicutes bacterium]|nr:YihA family ribosome biogenesis GTP-binding protein [Bacillota bacterium]MBR2001368.1 YihA family ribosome biogenesis GTP-binding protein [Bacillota bacterium]MBR7148366.1 YihA family ribosome biogenesis GTP-binding protein [Bacillota bacterium]